MTNTLPVSRQPFLPVRRLEYLTIAWNSLEALVSIIAGHLRLSVSLIGFDLEMRLGVLNCQRRGAYKSRRRRSSMNRLLGRILLTISLPLSFCAAQNSGTDHSIFNLNEIHWIKGPPSLPPGAEIAVLEGDPSKE